MDAQAGMQSGMTALIGALGGINMISGAGMLDFLVCQSAEKLVIDAEGIAMAQRLLDGFQVRTDTLATEFFAGFNFKADFLYQEATRDLFRLEQVQHSRVIDRGSLDQWQLDGSKDTFSRARDRVMEIVDEYQRPEVEPEKESALIALVSSFAKQAGMEKLPDLEL
jgi:trimethylamine--corrinoid protein Co-methyltransferase